MKRPEYVPQHFRRAPRARWWGRPLQWRPEHIGRALIAAVAVVVIASVAAFVLVGVTTSSVDWVAP